MYEFYTLPPISLKEFENGFSKNIVNTTNQIVDRYLDEITNNMIIDKSIDKIDKLFGYDYKNWGYYYKQWIVNKNIIIHARYKPSIKKYFCMLYINGKLYNVHLFRNSNKLVRKVKYFIKFYIKHNFPSMVVNPKAKKISII